MKYNKTIKQLKELQAQLLNKMLSEHKLLHLSDSEITPNLNRLDSSIENIEYLLQENKII